VLNFVILKTILPADIILLCKCMRITQTHPLSAIICSAWSLNNKQNRM